MGLGSRVTAPAWASRRPWMVAPVFAVTDVAASTVPTRCDGVPRAAELATCQNTLQAWAPLSPTTELPDAVTRVDPLWKMKTALGSPRVLRVSVPVMARVALL